MFLMLPRRLQGIYTPRLHVFSISSRLVSPLGAHGEYVYL